MGEEERAAREVLGAMGVILRIFWTIFKFLFRLPFAIAYTNREMKREEESPHPAEVYDSH